MGLDNIAMVKEADGNYRQAPDSMFNDVKLCQGILTDGASFRGKVYNSTVLELTGQSLYEDIGPFRLGQMAKSIDDWMAAHPGCGYCHTTREELATLANFFRICATNSLWLYAWY